MTGPAKIGFISYAHDDERMFVAFKEHLKPVRMQFPAIDIWDDTDIPPGALWEQTILERIARAELLILLVSPKFIYSDFIFKKEIPVIKQRRIDGALVLPVILRPCAYGVACEEVQAMPTVKGKLKPVGKWTPHSDGFDHVRKQISAGIQGHFGLIPVPSGMSVT